MPRKKGNGPGKGDGWGGPAKGADPNRKERAPAFEAGNTAAAGYHDMSKSQRIASLTEHLYGLALKAERQETQVSAAVALLNRLDGMPTAKMQNLGADGQPVDPVVPAVSVTISRS